MKHASGKVRVDKSIAYTYIRLEDGGFVAMIDNIEDSSTVQKEHEANASLICEAFNVSNETGKTPRQLADENKELLEALKLAIKTIGTMELSGVRASSDIKKTIKSAINKATN